MVVLSVIIVLVVSELCWMRLDVNGGFGLYSEFLVLLLICVCVFVVCLFVVVWMLCLLIWIVLKRIMCDMCVLRLL